MPTSFPSGRTRTVGNMATPGGRSSTREIASSDTEAIAPEKFGIDELLASGVPEAEAFLEVHTRVCKQLEITSAVVPASFPLELADHLRANGVEIRVDRERFEDRRRRKNATELAGLRRAQRACEAALDVARDMLRKAESN